jgi:hypothetical protein
LSAGCIDASVFDAQSFPDLRKFVIEPYIHANFVLNGQTFLSYDEFQVCLFNHFPHNNMEVFNPKHKSDDCFKLTLFVGDHSRIN